MTLEGRTAIVTGAARGIGKAIAARLARERMNIVIADVLDAAPAAADIARLGVRTLGLRADVSAEAEVAALVERTVSEFGGVDVLVNNAAMTAPPRPFEELTVAQWRRMMDVNAMGPFLLARAVAPHMRRRKRGRIINIASDTVHLGVPHLLHYVSSKGALIAFTRALARELGNDGVTVNAIAPGFTLSERIAAQTERVRGFRAAKLKELAIQRDELPEDLVGAAAFLAGDESAFITGQTLVVDGGYAMI